MQNHQYNYLQDYRRLFRSLSQIMTDIALPCYNESEKELFYMKWLIVDRFRTNHRLQEAKF